MATCKEKKTVSYILELTEEEASTLHTLMLSSDLLLGVARNDNVVWTSKQEDIINPIINAIERAE